MKTSKEVIDSMFLLFIWEECGNMSSVHISLLQICFATMKVNDHPLQEKTKLKSWYQMKLHLLVVLNANVLIQHRIKYNKYACALVHIISSWSAFFRLIIFCLRSLLIIVVISFYVEYTMWPMSRQEFELQILSQTNCTTWYVLFRVNVCRKQQVLSSECSSRKFILYAEDLVYRQSFSVISVIHAAD